MSMLPIYELKINEELDDKAEVSAVALVDEPAIQRDFLAFREQFIEPSKGEHQDEFLPRCISYVINEGKESEQAVAICNSIWDSHFAGGVSFDFDGVLTTKKGVDILDAAVKRGTEVYIISARSDDKGLKEFASKHNVKLDNVFATGSNKSKVEKIKEIQVSKHYDNNPDVIKEIGSIGEKFSFFGFQIISEDEHIVTGPLMIADEKIYRNNELMGEHYVVFSADTIKKIAIKFNKKKYQDSVNLMHDPSQIVEGVTMFESWIVDSKRGVKPMQGFEDVSEGSWFGSFYVENQDVWNRVKSGEFKGFSVEGNFDYAEPEAPKTSEEMMLEKINKLLNEIITD